MNYADDFLNLHPLTFVSELVRRQRPRYEIPFAVTNRKAHLRDEHITKREPALRFRWVDTFDESGAHYLRSHVLKAG